MRVSTICAAVFATGITCALAQANCLPAQFQATLPAPPQDDWADAQRLQLMVELRTPERIAAIEQEADDLTFKFWHSAGLQSRAHPQLERQITAVQKIAEKIVLSLKAQYARTRKHICTAPASQVLAEPVEQCFTHPVWRGAQARRAGHRYFAALVEPADDADFTRRDSFAANDFA